jgi:hypothetical protein
MSLGGFARAFAAVIAALFMAAIVLVLSGNPLLAGLALIVTIAVLAALSPSAAPPSADK